MTQDIHKTSSRSITTAIKQKELFNFVNPSTRGQRLQVKQAIKEMVSSLSSYNLGFLSFLEVKLTSDF